MSPAGSVGRRVLVVEDSAHRPGGHFPTRCAELAEGFIANGCSAEVLTSQGWLQRGQTGRFAIGQYGRFDRLLYRLGEACRTRRGLRGIGRRLRTVALVRAARARRRQAGEPPPEVVVVSMGIDPIVGSLYAGPGRWLLYEFGGGPPPRRHRLTGRAARAERQRRASGGRARLAVPSDEDRDRWAKVAPFLDPVALPIAGSRDRVRIADARARLGVAPDDLIALVFGTGHWDKDIDLVARAFGELPAWRVLVAGSVARHYRPREGGQDPIVIGGYLDETMRAVVFSAADLVVLSFRPGFHRNSGVLMDAVSWGVPVVCSDTSRIAEIVRAYRLGDVFPVGDAHALARTVQKGPPVLDPADLARARAELSNRVVAARFLDTLAEDGAPVRTTS
jgi:glycosyltransferase involved in cell wall biosynthesis